MAWDFAKALNSPTSVPTVLRYPVGTGGVQKGMPVVLGSGGDANKVILKVGGTNAVAVFGVAMGTVASGGFVEVAIGSPEMVFTIKLGNGSAPVAGTKYGLQASTLDLDQANVTQTMVKVLEPTPDRTGFFNCIVLGWLA